MGREGGGGKGLKGGQEFFLEPETWNRGEQPGEPFGGGTPPVPCENRNSFCVRRAQLQNSPAGPVGAADFWG